MKDHSFFVKLFVSFSVLLVLITVVYLLIYDQVVINSSKEEIGKNYIGKLKVAEKIMTEFKNTVQKDIVRLAATNSINTLGEIKNLEKEDKVLFDNQSLMKLSNAQKSILEVVNANIRYDSIYLYIEDMGYCLTSNQGLIFQTDFNDAGWLKSYIEYKNGNKPLGWIDTRVSDINISSSFYTNYDYVVTYIFPLTPYTSVLQGALVLNVKEDTLSQLINTDDVNKEGYIFVIDNTGDVITHIDKSFVGQNISHIDYIHTIINSSLVDGYFINETDRQNNLISFYKSYKDNWIYVGVFSLEPLLSKIGSLRIRIIYFSILIAFLSVSSVYLMSKKLSSPITELIQDIKLNKGIDIYEGKDEMLILKRAFESLSSRLVQNKFNIRQIYLSKLLNGNYSYGIVEDEHIAEDCFKYEYFVCASVVIDKYYDFASKYEAERQYYLKMLIINIAKQVIGMNYICEGVNLDGGEMAFIINISENHIDRICSDLRNCFNEIQNEISKILDFTVSVGVGTCYKGKTKIHNSYAEAKQALKWRLVVGYGNVISWSEQFENYSYYYPYTTEKSILSQLESKDLDKIKKTVNELICELKEKADISCDNIMLIINQLVGNTIVKYFTELKIDISNVFGNNFDIYSELSRKETLDDLEDWLVFIYKSIIDYIIAYEEEQDETVREIVDFIKSNYNKDIGIQEVASYVGLSYSHVRKVFKDKIGENIVEFINRLRIEEGKKLLRSSDLPVREIALAVGYNSDQTFARIFKKMEGITPGDYRRCKVIEE